MIEFDAREIERWAGSPDAPHRLPLLIRRLILATVPTASLIDMPGGSSVWQSGWDGLLESKDSNPWVPADKSVWEFGAGKNPQSKANDDYNNRAKKLLGVKTDPATFVFVTPRVWSGKRDWVERRKEECRWTDVRAYDADDLVAWLEQAPGVADWLAQIIGSLPPDSGFVCLDDWWEHWSFKTNPTTQPELVVAGRSQESDAVRNWLNGPASTFYVQGDTREEATAFLAASALTASDHTKASLFAKAVVVRTPGAWRSLERGNYPMVLIRDFVDDEASRVAVNKGHHVMLPLDRTQDLHGKGRALARLGRDETLNALQSMGMPEHQARALSRKSARRLPVIRRFLLDEAGAQSPEWASGPPLRTLTALVPLGQWSEDSEGDTEVVARLAGKPYEEVQQELTPLLNIADAPLTKIGAQWRYVSHEEAWHILALNLTSTDAERFEELAAGILGRKHPKFDLPIEERWYSSIKGKDLPFSETLVEGIARALALIGTQFERMENVQNARYIPDRVVHRVLTDDSDWRTWGTLSGLLATLAEAAPDAFLDAVEKALDAETSPFMELFSQEGDLDPMFSGTPHTGLLWGLERLAWSKEHFSRVAIALAKLTEIDPGGQVSNRPLESLTGLFHVWISFTDLTDEERLEVLEMLLLLQRYSTAGWSALVNAFPSVGHNGIVLRKDPPLWQPWGQDGHSTATYATLWQFVDEMIRLLLENVGVDVARWKDLVGILASMPKQARQDALNLLARQTDSLIQDAEVEPLRAAIRKELNSHRSYPDADWAMPSEDVDILKTIYDKLTPDDPVAANAWLFNSDRPDLPDGERMDYEERGKRIDAARQKAGLAVFEFGGVDAILNLIDTVNCPHILGDAIANVIDGDETFSMALECVTSEQQKRKDFAWAYLRACCLQFGLEVLDRALCAVKSDDSFNPRTVAEIYTAASSVALKGCLKRLESESQVIQDTYWNIVNWISFMGSEVETQDRLFAIRRLLAARRSLSVTQLIWPRAVPSDIVASTLEQIPKDLAEGREAINQDLGYEIAQLFKILDESEDVSDGVIANLEMPFIGVLEQHRPNLALHREVLCQPSLFADLITLYASVRLDGRYYDETLDDRTRERQTLYSYSVLSKLRSLPGAMQDGVVDAEILRTWVYEVRRLCAEQDRAEIGDQKIGEVLANAPIGADGVWPCEPVRELLDTLSSSERIGNGFTVGRFNQRGIVSKGIYDGGVQERELAKKYHEYADGCAAQWPFTAKLLRDMARGYEADARREDTRAEWTDETWA